MLAFMVALAESVSRTVCSGRAGGGRPPKSTGHMGASTQGVNTDVYTARNPPPPPPAQSDAPVSDTTKPGAPGPDGRG